MPMTCHKSLLQWSERGYVPDGGNDLLGGYEPRALELAWTAWRRTMQGRVPRVELWLTQAH